MGSKRTIITIPDDYKVWLESYSKAYNVSISEAVRQGIFILKETMEKNTYQRLIKNTKGIWKKGDGLKYQKKIRAEWQND